jgi:hypothetical protein
MDEATAQIMFWALVSVGSLALLETFIIIWQRKALGFEIRLWWKKPKGYGIMEIINNDGTREHRIEKLTDEEIRIAGEDDQYQRYITERKLYTYRLHDRVSVGTWYRNIPNMMNLTGRIRNIRIEEGTKEINLPEPFRQEDIEKADVFDSIILKHKQLKGDFLSKYWKYIVAVVLVVGLITLVGFYMLHSKQTDILEGCIAQTDMIKSICTQKAVVGV